MGLWRRSLRHRYHCEGTPRQVPALYTGTGEDVHRLQSSRNAVYNAVDRGVAAVFFYWTFATKTQKIIIIHFICHYK